jgi:small conductance mechanosensitive channel
VQDISLRLTTLRQPEGPLVLIPNKAVFQNPLVNFSRLGRRRIDVEVGVAYGEDLPRAREVALAAVEQVEGREQATPPELFYTAFGDSSITFTARFWIDETRQADWLAARSDAIVRIKQAFDDAGITIPFPIRTLDFGNVGGVPLAEALPQRFRP